LRLAIIEGNNAGREIPLEGEVLVGRSPDADVVLADEEVSMRHASFVESEGVTSVEDLGSTNGTFVNGERLTERRDLAAGDRVRIGATVLEVRGPGPAPATSVAQIAVAKPTRVKEIPTLPVLVFVSGQEAGTEVPVSGQVVVGRDPGAADVVLDQDAEVSRRHTTFSRAGTGLTVQDLGSTNGTFVNGTRLEEAVSLNNGDKVQIGDTIIDVRFGGQAVIEPPPVAAAAPGAPANDIVVENLVKEFGKHRAVDDVSLSVSPAEIYGFLGPNGAGKSTTVLMLTTLLRPTAGTARVSGFDVRTQGADIRSSIGVALQAAALDPHLNAWEHMQIQTTLQGIPRAERKQRGKELIERVGLIEAADRPVNGYSGGMKRRLDLALALVHRPRVLFLDEPTTGLDPQSRTALWEEVARLVKEEGMTVFLTTQYLEEADVMADRVGIIDHGEIVAEGTPAALKEEIGRPTVEVVPVNPDEWQGVSDVLNRFGELVSASDSGGVAVRLGAGVDDLAEVIRALDAAGLRIANLQVHAPTLDDVFLAKTGRSLEGAAEEPEEEQPGVLEQVTTAGVPVSPNPIARP
jgi:ABC-2 type transport system ATP-binding protein